MKERHVCNENGNVYISKRINNYTKYTIKSTCCFNGDIQIFNGVKIALYYSDVSRVNIHYCRTCSYIDCTGDIRELYTLCNDYFKKKDIDVNRMYDIIQAVCNRIVVMEEIIEGLLREPIRGATSSQQPS